METEVAKWRWENMAAGAIAGFTAVVSLHPLDVVRTRFQVNDGRSKASPNVHVYKNTTHALYTIARMEGLRGLYAGFCPAVIGSTVSWGLYFFFYNQAKQRYMKGDVVQLSPALHMVSAAEAGSLVCLCTNPIWVVKLRLQLQSSSYQIRKYSGFADTFKTIVKEEGVSALYKGIGPGLLLVSHGAIQFTAYEEFRLMTLRFKKGKYHVNEVDDKKILNSVDYAALGAMSKVTAILLTYPYQVIRARLQVDDFVCFQQRPGADGISKYRDSWHVVKETARFEGLPGFYRGITSNMLKNIPSASIAFVVYENVLKFFKSRRT
ncbi:Folate transporter 1, chloroplastic [Zostera marina]|uniref:Folate transporter 1, chloroplastic n=1 Tax=Zostera marina TaxID=29655 RepID=A0A0K9PXP7_ZOSMR|nr:Folate transporter 1, chloroplastic [Zostera marina]